MIITILSRVITALITLLTLCVTTYAADVIIIGDNKLKPVRETIRGAREIIDDIKVYSAEDAKNRIPQFVAHENAKAIIVTGRDLAEQATKTPSHISLVYTMTVTPIETSRPNTAGIYMVTPLQEYVSFIKEYFPAIKRIAVICSPDLIAHIGSLDHSCKVFLANNPLEAATAIENMYKIDAIIFTPDVNIFRQTTAIDELLLTAHKKNIPVFSFTEKHVERGGLAALVINPVDLGRQAGALALRALKGDNIGNIPVSSPGKFDIVINSTVAKKMGITIPEKLFRKAIRTY